MEEVPARPQSARVLGGHEVNTFAIPDSMDISVTDRYDGDRWSAGEHFVNSDSTGSIFDYLFLNSAKLMMAAPFPVVQHSPRKLSSRHSKARRLMKNRPQ